MTDSERNYLLGCEIGAETARARLGVEAQEKIAALENCLIWIDGNRRRLHEPNCTIHRPDARCSCGLHRVLTDLRGVIADMKAEATHSGS